MKICPKCQKTYEDNQGFCLNDGTPLSTLNPAGAPPPPQTGFNQAPPTNPNQPFGSQQQNNWSAPQQPPFSMQPQKQKSGSKTWLLVAGVLGLLLLLCGGGLVGAYFFVADRIDQTLQTVNSYSNTTNTTTNSVSNSNSKNTLATPRSATTGVLSQAKYDQIKTDMSRSEVESILGGPGREISNTKAGGSTIATHEWKGEEYSVIYVVFRNDKVFSKTSANLK